LEPFKNNFSPQLVTCIADHLQTHIASFDRKTFEAPIHEKLGDLELKERSQLIADQVHLALPNDHAERARVLNAMLHPAGADQPSDEHGICGWGIFPLSMVVGQHGLDDFERSLSLLKEMTSRFSSEFGIRYFLLADQERTLDIIRNWVDHPNQHVRRLVSEGTRPRLPWAMQLPRLVDDPAPMLPILEALRDDEEEYVRRSVANHLNDIAKDHPDLIAQLAHHWLRGADKSREKLIRRACRTLIKQGCPNALQAFGFEKPKLLLDSLVIETKVVELGGALTFSAKLRSTSAKAQPLVIDYLVHFQKANGKLSGKVFKWKEAVLQSSELLTLQRSHAIRPITTRRYYAGRHALSLRINGKDFGYAEFDLMVPAGETAASGKNK